MNCETIGDFQFMGGEGVFPLGNDSLKLGKFVTIRKGWKVCDLGTGSGILLLLLARRQPELHLFGVDICPRSVQLARENMAKNGLKSTILEEKLQKTTLPKGTFDLVIANPPYFSPSSGKGNHPARQEEACTLEEVCQSAGSLLKNGGRFALVHRPERLVDVFCQMRASGIEPKRMQLVAHSPSHPPSAVLVEGIKQGRPSLSIEVGAPPSDI